MCGNAFLNAIGMEKKGNKKGRLNKGVRSGRQEGNDEGQPVSSKPKRFIVYVSSHCFE
jgi:hypothetical protein